ncbi:MAG: hypothetical protein AAGB46_05975, partial [Verrucomicrobiota bacterium]
MAFAGHSHVVDAIENDLDGPLEQMGGEGGVAPPVGRLVFLAPESSSESFLIDLDLVHRKTQYMGDFFLHGGRTLGGREKENMVVVVGGG